MLWPLELEELHPGQTGKGYFLPCLLPLISSANLFSKALAETQNCLPSRNTINSLCESRKLLFSPAGKMKQVENK